MSMCPLQLPTYSSHQKLPDGVAVHVNFSRPFCTVGWFLKVEKVHMANFEAFCQILSSHINHLFLKSDRHLLYRALFCHF